MLPAHVPLFHQNQWYRLQQQQKKDIKKLSMSIAKKARNWDAHLERNTQTDQKTKVVSKSTAHVSFVDQPPDHESGFEVSTYSLNHNVF